MEAFINYIKDLESRLEVLENLHNNSVTVISDYDSSSDEISEDNNLPLRTIYKVRGKIDDKLIFRGNGKIIVYKDYYVMSGNQPRMYGLKLIKNVDVTVDYMRIGTDGKNWSGCNIGVRSGPEGHSKSPEKAHTYYFRLRHDNKVDFYKEVIHSGEANRITYKEYQWTAKKWYNVKFKCYNLPNDSIKLEGYINGKLVLEYIDDDDRMDYTGIAFVRNTDIKESRYKNFFYKEINIKKNNNKTIIGYYPEWAIYNYKYSVKDIPDNIKIICYAFMLSNPSKKDLQDANLKYPPVPSHFKDPEGILIPHDEEAFKINMKELKKVNKIKLISLGGWTLSFNFCKILRIDILRERFVASIIYFLNENNFDGVDIDWEYPNKPGRKQNNMENQYSKKEDDGKYLKLFLEELKQQRPNIILTAAVGMNPLVYKAFIGCEDLLNYVILMLYDRKGKTWGEDYKYQADIKTDKIMIKRFKEICNFNDNQIIIGCPLYYRGQWKGEDKGTLNFGYKYNEDGLISIKDIKESLYEEKYDEEYGADYIENDEWRYDGANIKDKKELSNQYGGIAMWNLADVTKEWFEKNI